MKATLIQTCVKTSFMKALNGSDENCILEEQKYYLMRLEHSSLSFWRRTVTALVWMLETSDPTVCSTIPSRPVLSPKIPTFYEISDCNIFSHLFRVRSLVHANLFWHLDTVWLLHKSESIFCVTEARGGWVCTKRSDLSRYKNSNYVSCAPGGHGRKEKGRLRHDVGCGLQTPGEQGRGGEGSTSLTW